MSMYRVLFWADETAEVGDPDHDGPSDEAAGSSVTATRAYGWQVVGDYEANDPHGAIRLAVPDFDLRGGEYAAVPKGYWTVQHVDVAAEPQIKLTDSTKVG